jgi:hypothetical protein
MKFHLQALALLALAAAPALRAQDQNPVATLLDRIEPSVVTVRVVAEIELPGGSREFEQAGPGVVVDASGLIMVASDLLDPSARLSRMMGGNDVRANVSSVKVVIGNEVDPLEATVAAKDSKLGLSFVKIGDIGDRKLQSIDFENSTRPSVGDDIYAVVRLSEGFDYAPYYMKGEITGRIKKPRRAFCLNVGFGPGTPVFLASGELAGVVCVLEAGEEIDTFVVAAKVVANSVQQAIKQANGEAAAEVSDEAAGDDEDGDGGK